MTIGIPEIAVMTAAIALVLWLLPKTLPVLGSAIRQFQEELKRK